MTQQEKLSEFGTRFNTFLIRNLMIANTSLTHAYMLMKCAGKTSIYDAAVKLAKKDTKQTYSIDKIVEEISE